MTLFAVSHNGIGRAVTLANRREVMRRSVVCVVAAAVVAIGTQVDAQGRRNRQDVARAQGVPPGQLPPSNQCRVWYDSRPNGRQPSATSCRQAEAMAARDRNARVIYGEDVYWSLGPGYNSTDIYGDYGNGGAVRRDGRVRDPRVTGGVMNDQRGVDGYGRSTVGRNTTAYQNGYRDGMTKGRDDGEDADQYDATRHGWYRSASRGYDDDLGNKTQYQSRYRQGFEAGYAEGYRVNARR
jgi:hypothetical protein